MQNLAQSLQDANAASIGFLNVEVDTGLTFARIAQDSKDADKAKRNRENARIAYNTILRFIGRVSLTEAESESLAGRMAQLRKALEQLGEKF